MTLEMIRKRIDVARDRHDYKRAVRYARVALIGGLMTLIGAGVSVGDSSIAEQVGPSVAMVGALTLAGGLALGASSFLRLQSYVGDGLRGDMQQRMTAWNLLNATLILDASGVAYVSTKGSRFVQGVLGASAKEHRLFWAVLTLVCVGVVVWWFVVRS